MTEASLAAAMLGETPTAARSADAARSVAGPAPVAVLKHIKVNDSRATWRNPVDLEVMGGEVLGVAALEGAASPLLRTLAGRLTPYAGTIDVPDHVGFVPENRQEEGVISDFSLAENFALRNAGNRTGLIRWNQMRDATSSVIRDFDVRATSSDSTMSDLSGGNQQRFVLGRELEDKPQLLVLENPTQGLDVRATAGIHERVRSAREQGTAIVFYSSDIDELAEISDRVLVIRSTGFAFSEPVRESIGRLLLEADVAKQTDG